MQALKLRLRHGTAEPVETELSPSLLDRIQDMRVSHAISQILESVPEEKRSYAHSMRTTMDLPNSIVELLNPSDEEIVSVSRNSRESFAQVLSRLTRHNQGRAQDLGALEIGTAHLEQGGTARTTNGASKRSADCAGAGSLIPPQWHATPRHSFFAAAELAPLLVWRSSVWRMSPDASARSPWVTVDGQMFTLNSPQPLEEMDAAYWEDNDRRFEEMISTAARRIADQEITSISAASPAERDDLADLVVSRLIPRLRRYHLGETSTPDQAESVRLRGPWRPREPSLAALLPTSALVVGSQVRPLFIRLHFPLTPRPSTGLHGLVFSYEAKAGVPLARFESEHSRLLTMSIESEALRRSPEHVTQAMTSKRADEQRRVCRALRLRSRSSKRPLVVYQDPYHAIIAEHGALLLCRHVPAFVVRSARRRAASVYWSAPTWLSIDLSTGRGPDIFYRGCVKTRSALRHPLISHRGVVLMDRCEGDMENLRSAYDVSLALVKHLLDAKMMLELGHPLSPPPDCMPLIPRDKVERMGLPLYNYRHK